MLMDAQCEAVSTPHAKVSCGRVLGCALGKVRCLCLHDGVMNMPERGSGMVATASPLQFMCRVIQMQPFYSLRLPLGFPRKPTRFCSSAALHIELWAWDEAREEDAAGSRDRGRQRAREAHEHTRCY